MSPLNPTSPGSVYTIDAIDFYNNIVPTTPLDDNHAFCALWELFLINLEDGCDSFWDAMMRIYTGQTASSFAGNRNEIKGFKKIYLENPPNVVIADMQSLTLYGRHQRLPRLWSYIYISKFYVDQWVGAKDETVAMAYEGLLKATLVHESAHWAQTLRVGLYPAELTQNQLDNDNLPPAAEQLRMKKKITPKRFQTFLSPDHASGEAGYYVEVAVFGGSVSVRDHKLIIATTSNTSPSMVSAHALRELRNHGLCRLISLATLTPQLPSPTPIRNGQGLPGMLNDSDDEELLSPSHRCPREYPILDVMAATGFPRLG